MLTTSVPDSSCTSTVSSRGVLDISSNFFLINSFSVALWKYLDLAILSTNLKIFFPVLPPPALQEKIRAGGEMRLYDAMSTFGSDAKVKIRPEMRASNVNEKRASAIWSVMSVPSIFCGGENEHSRRRWVVSNTSRCY